MTAGPPPVILLVGTEALRLREAEQAEVDAALAGDRSGFNLARIQANEPEALGRLLDLVRTVPMMADRRVVVLRELDKASVALQDALLDYVDNPSPSTTLILVGSQLPASSGGVNRGVRLRNRIQKIGRVRSFKSGAEDPRAFAVERARELGCRLDRDAAELLVELAGKDLGRVDMELTKASNWLGGSGTIDIEVIEQTCSVVGQAEIWALTGALIRRDVDGALAACHRLLEAGEAPHYILSMVTWQFRQLLCLQDCMRRGRDPKEGGVRLRWRTLEEAKRNLARRPLVAADLLPRLAAANRRFNRSPAGDRRVLEALVLEVVTR